ncbi:serine/threonine-protein kinase rio2 [Eurytemora carolleeae]|uniref:serine/threonine-protein kinase rio2 n=1 Tax=Eurytemora carolleeae TaxID=1294199 RepID=UPI000C75DE8A|nr:serine/threonine-protein kinase rio2 [Eurytemora carolleeae]|eukprot:XP_023349571.1 serine/threonine-protein kinase rio2-like [Eurytemora affinis]
MRILVILIGALCLLNAEAVRERKRPLMNRRGRFIGTHLDLLGAASSIFQNYANRRIDVADAEDVEYVDVSDDESNDDDDIDDHDDTVDYIDDDDIVDEATADKLISASPEDLKESDTIRSMAENLDILESFGEKINNKDTESYEDPREQSNSLYTSEQEGTPESLVFICSDPLNCPPPYGYPGSYGPPPPPPTPAVQGYKPVSPPPGVWSYLGQYGVRRGSTTARPSPPPTYYLEKGRRRFGNQLGYRSL